MKLNKYQKFMPPLFSKMKDELNGYISEYEFIKDSDSSISSWLQSDRFNEDFHIFFKNSVGSLVGFWLLNEDFSKNPIVFFGRDGDLGVLADNFNSFLSQLNLLGADTWQLSEYLSHLEFQLGSGLYYVLTENQISEHMEMIINDFGGNETLEWLKKNNIKELTTKDLFSTVKETYLKNPNLKLFIEEQKLKR